jgi:hypothetical protein
VRLLFKLKLFAAIVLILTLSASAQQVFDSGQRVFVTALPQDLPQIAAGKPTVIEMRFRVTSGMHINSHKPNENYLIPTTLALDAAPGVQWGTVEYPVGEERVFPFSPTEKLNVYTGDITLHMHLNAQPGVHTLNATLRYQACDNRACYPSQTVPVRMIVEAK